MFSVVSVCFFVYSRGSGHVGQVVHGLGGQIRSLGGPLLWGCAGQGGGHMVKN